MRSARSVGRLAVAAALVERGAGWLHFDPQVGLVENLEPKVAAPSKVGDLRATRRAGPATRTRR